MKKITLFLLVMFLLSTIYAGDFFMAKQCYESPTLFVWDHLEDSWMTEIVTDSKGCKLLVAVGPVFSYSKGFELKLPISLDFTDDLTFCGLSPAVRANWDTGLWSFQSWHTVNFNSKRDMELSSWVTSDYALFFLGKENKLGIGIQSRVDAIIMADCCFTPGIMYQHIMERGFSVETFLGTNHYGPVTHIALKLYL